MRLLRIMRLMRLLKLQGVLKDSAASSQDSELFRLAR